jgi:hypothetical protein
VKTSSAATPCEVHVLTSYCVLATAGRRARMEGPGVLAARAGPIVVRGKFGVPYAARLVLATNADRVFGFDRTGMPAKTTESKGRIS